MLIIRLASKSSFNCNDYNFGRYNYNKTDVQSYKPANI